MSMRVRHDRWKDVYHIDIETEGVYLSVCLDGNDGIDLLLALVPNLTEGACEALQRATAHRIDLIKGAK